MWSDNKEVIMDNNNLKKPVVKKRKRAPLLWGLVFGIIFGFLLQKGGVTKYDLIVGQLLLQDFTVLKVILSAIITGMIGIYIMKTSGWVELHPKPGSVGMSLIGGLIFGVGFAVLGYCPGTIAGAVGNGYLDALVGGVLGILLGAGLFATIYPKLKEGILKKGNFGNITLPQLFKVNDWFVIVPICILLAGLLYWWETAGL